MWGPGTNISLFIRFYKIQRDVFLIGPKTTRRPSSLLFSPSRRPSPTHCTVSTVGYLFTPCYSLTLLTTTNFLKFLIAYNYIFVKRHTTTLHWKEIGKEDV